MYCVLKKTFFFVYRVCFFKNFFISLGYYKTKNMKKIYTLNKRLFITEKKHKLSFDNNTYSFFDKILCVYNKKPTHKDLFTNPLVNMFTPFNYGDEEKICEYIDDLLNKEYVVFDNEPLSIQNFFSETEIIQDEDKKIGYLIKEQFIEDSTYKNIMKKQNEYTPLDVYIKTCYENKPKHKGQIIVHVSEVLTGDNNDHKRKILVIDN